MKNSFITIVIVLLFSACTQETKVKSDETSSSLFTNVNSSHSNIDFVNKIFENKDFNYYKYDYLYNGGGVAIGDINNDGLADIYLSATQGYDKLYLNKGDFKFEDISDASGIGKFTGYKTGINMVDINSDGWLDIYVCRSGWSQNEEDRSNLLFINQKDGTFSEESKQYNLAESNRSIQSVFFDYDKDGDLDVYISNHPSKFREPLNEVISHIKSPRLIDSDKLYQNQGNNTYKDVTKSSGVLNFGFGLGVVAGDFNNDQWTDLYVTSDFEPRDLYYINQKDGTFKESLEEHFNHCSYFSMGVDMVDINNDKSLDLFIGEMLAEDNLRQKTNMAPMDIERFSSLVSNGMYFQYMRNSFFINNGNGDFYDVAPYSGIDKSDWSWSTLFGDYDNDGDDDLLIANGWLKDTQDKDLAKKANKLAEKTDNRLNFNQISELLKSTPLKNYAYKNEGNLKFTKSSDEWAFNHTGFSNGMAYGDLDNDGDLDIVVNNINEEASLYRNNKDDKNFITIELGGPKGNELGLNSKLSLYSNCGMQYKEFQTIKGFQSAVQPRIHYGIKSNCTIDSLEIIWNDGQRQVAYDLNISELNRIDYAPNGTSIQKKIAPIFKEEDISLFVHKENYFDDYKLQVLIPHLLSQLGPALSTGDLNNDGLDDIFIGGAAGQPSQLLIQSKNGTFKSTNEPLFYSHRQYEDVESLLFDYNNDGLLDIYVGSGSSEFHKNRDLLTDRIYKNLGSGKFEFVNILPTNNFVTGTVTSGDIDQDGDLDLFVGSRLEIGKYPTPSSSYIYINEGSGYTNKTSEIAPELMNIGLINTSKFIDIDGDQDLDLIIAGEWTSINILVNQNGKFSGSPMSNAKDMIGWWNSIESVDLNNDGLPDFLIGNLGQNYKYQATTSEPFEVYSGDLNNDGSNDIVLGYHSDDKVYPVRGFQCSSEQMPDLKEKIASYEEFGKSDIFSIYGKDLDNSLNYRATNFSSGVLWNKGGLNFEFQEFDYPAQLFPIQDFEILDIDNDNDLDIIAAGNWFVAEVETPRADSGQGIVIENLGDQKFKYLTFNESGLLANKDVRNIALVKGPDSKIKLVVANNNSGTQVFSKY